MSLALMFWDSDPASVIEATLWSLVSLTPLARGSLSVRAAVIVTDTTEAHSLPCPTPWPGERESLSLGLGPPGGSQPEHLHLSAPADLTFALWLILSSCVWRRLLARRASSEQSTEGGAG